MFALISPPVSAQSLRFEHLTIENGLSQNSVFCLLQDRYGLLWIGTEGGLNLYDGQRFRTFTRDADDNASLSDNVVSALSEDRDGTIWVGTGNGLNRFNRESEDFIRIVDADQGLYDSISITSLLLDNSGYLWVATQGHGLFRYNPWTCIIDRHYIHVPEDPTTLSCNDVETLFAEDGNVIWIGTAGGGVNRFVPETGSFERLKNADPDPGNLEEAYVRTVIRSKHNPDELWIGTWDQGLILYNLRNSTAERFLPSSGFGSISHHEIKSLLEDSEGGIWVGTSAGGVNFFDRQQRTFTAYRHAAHLKDSLSQDDISVLYEDRSRILWIGTISAGLNKYVRHKNLFKRYGHDPLSAGSLSNGFVRSLLIDRQQQLWVGTYGGLNIYDPLGDIFIPMQYLDKEEHRGRMLIESLSEDSSGGIWMATFSGIARFDPVRQDFFWYEHDEKPDSLSHQIVYAVLADRQDRIWAGTYHGLNRMDDPRKGFVHYLHNPKDAGTIPHNMVISLFEDFDSTLWVGTAGGGLARLNPKSGRFKSFSHSQTDGRSLSHNNVSAIYRDTKGRLWIGTADGLNLMDEENSQFTRFGRRNGLPSTSIAAIVEDQNGALWLTHNAGLTSFSPETGEIRNFTSKDGLQGTEFNRGSAAKSEKGELILGGINGFNRFFPDELKGIQHQAPIHVTNLVVMGNPWGGGAPHYSVSKMELGASQNQLTISFASNDYSSPEQTHYQYILQGLDLAWTDSGFHRTAHYNQLPAGRFFFKVKASLDGINWGEEHLLLVVDKVPHFWKTWWFRALFIVFISLSVYGFYLVRIHSYRRRLEEERQTRKILENSEQELRRAHQIAALRLAQLRELMSSITSILIALDRNGTISECNQRAAAFFNLEREGMLNQPLEQFLQGGYFSLNSVLDWAYNPPIAVKERQFVIKKNHEHRLFHLWVYPIMTEEAHYQGLLLLFDDITEQSSQEIQQYLWEKLKTIGQLQAEITHEIGTPIQEAKFQAYLLDKALTENLKEGEIRLAGEDTREFQDGLTIIQSNIDRVFAIIRSAKELFYPGRNQKEDIDINKMIDTTLMVTRNSLQKRARISVKLGQDLPLVQGYPAELNQVLLNLLSNAADAVDHLEGKGEITLSTELRENEVVLEVSDNGTGIDPVIGAQMFAPFFTTKEAGKGTGQGLTLSRNIIEKRHGGRIEWLNKPSGGASFIVFLPARFD